MRITNFYNSLHNYSFNAASQKSAVPAAAERLTKGLSTGLKNAGLSLDDAITQTSVHARNSKALSMLGDSFKIAALHISEFVRPKCEKTHGDFLIQKTGKDTLSTFQVEEETDEEGNVSFKAIDEESKKVIAESDSIENLRESLNRKLADQLVKTNALEELGELIKYHTDWDGFKEMSPLGKVTEFFTSEDESSYIYVQRIDEDTLFPVLIELDSGADEAESLTAFELRGSEKIELPEVKTPKHIEVLMNRKFAESLVEEPTLLDQLRVGDFLDSAPAPSRPNFMIFKKGDNKFDVLRFQQGQNESGRPRKHAVDVQSEQIVATSTVRASTSRFVEEINKKFFPKYHTRMPIFVDTKPSKNIPLTFSYLTHVANLNTGKDALPYRMTSELDTYGGIISPENEARKNGNASEIYGGEFADIESKLIEKAMAKCTPGTALFTSMEKLKNQLSDFSRNAVEFDFSIKLKKSAEIKKTTEALFGRIKQSNHFAMPLVFYAPRGDTGMSHVTAIAFTKNPDGTFDIEFMNRGYGVNQFHDRLPSPKGGDKFNTVKVYRGIEMTTESDRPGALHFDTFLEMIEYANANVTTSESEDASAFGFGESSGILPNLAGFHGLLDSLAQKPESSSLPLELIQQAPQKDANCGYSSIRSYMRTLVRDQQLFAQMEFLSKTELSSAAQQFMKDAAPLAAKDAKVNANISLLKSTTLPIIEQKIEQAMDRILNFAIQSPGGNPYNEITVAVIQKKLETFDATGISVGGSSVVVGSPERTLLFHRASENRIIPVMVEQQATAGGHHHIARELTNKGTPKILAQGISLEDVKMELKNRVRWNRA
ncbi:MAG: hypothetical protein QE278_08035 [Limnobacter sp.]|nr:hypothetical protein [Limnobacter sp.]